MNSLKSSLTILVLSIVFLLSCGNSQTEVENPLPNIIYILADDLGYGDISHNNPNSKIQTPNIDGLIAEGMQFTDAHSTSSVCTPTRYSIMTGNYAWRSRLKQGVLWSYGESLIEKDQLTVPAMLKEKGYKTGVVGKWHLGLGWPIKEEYKDSVNRRTADINELGLIKNLNGDWVDFSQPLKSGPWNYGFDFNFVLPASLDIPPYCYIEDDRLVVIPDSLTEGSHIEGDKSGPFWRPGRISKGFEFDHVLPDFLDKSKEFISSHQSGSAPFFLYLPLAAPHTPWVPTDTYKDKSGAGLYGDFVQMIDEKIGQLLSYLREHNLEENTLVIFTSDNGPYWLPDKIEAFGHKSAYHFRGMKADIHEGGHRIPFVVKWPGKIKPSTESNIPTTLANLMATLAELTEATLEPEFGKDSFSILPELLDQPERSSQAPPIIHHSSLGHFAIRKGPWKLIEKRGSGGFTQPYVIEPKEGEPLGELYNLELDISEQNNLYLANPDIVSELTYLLDSIRK
ncbi:MAG: sulfatase family protein [Cyclobacteriaceae bacterium]